MSDQHNKENERMILAFDAKRLFHNYTGLGNYSRTLVKNLQAFFPEHEYHLFTPSIRENEETAYFLDKEKFTIHIPDGIKPFWRTFGMASDINTLQPDIFHGLSHEMPLGIHHTTKTIISFHDLIFEKYPEQFGWLDQKFYHLKYKSSAKRANHIVAISDSTARDLQEMYQINPGKISVLYQSCHDRFQETVPSKDDLPASIKNLEPYFLYVGSVIERKGLLQCVIAYAKLPKQLQKPFVIIGKGDKNYYSKVTDMIKYYGLQRFFFFVDSVSNASLVEIYDRSFCLLYPSIYEGFGIPVIESLFRKKPVITSDISSLPEAAGPGAILVNPFSPDDIAKAMTWLEDKAVYEDLAHKGYTYVSSQFSSQKTANELMEFYKDITQK